MTHSDQATATRLLHDLHEGHREAVDQLLPLVYDELHRLAQRERQRWHGDYTFNTTALVHEAYLKLVDQSQVRWESRAHFQSVAAKAMRHLLIDYARRRRAEKRGGDVPKLSLEEMKLKLADVLAAPDGRDEVLVLLDDALQRLQVLNERQSRIVECRFFGGMTIEETAVALNTSPATVKRGWALAQAWLYEEIRASLGAG